MHRWAGRATFALATFMLGERKVFSYLRTARRVHGLDRAELLRRQEQHLTGLLDWVAEHNPYYAPQLGARVLGGGIARLRELPLLEKRTLQEKPDSLRTPNFRGRLMAKSTGGSTGAPVRIVKDADGIARELATTWAALGGYGIRIGDRSVRFWGTPLRATRRLRFRLTDLAVNRIRLSAFDLDESDLNEYWRRCVRFRPAWFYGYASLIHLFADWLERTGRDGSAIGLKAVIPTSEPLNDGQRAQIARVFDAPVFDEYGCGEVGAMAYASDHHRLHVMTENIVLEVLDDAQQPVAPGETGEVVITDLTNRAMPLIRYRLGDRAVQGADCSCGRGFPVIERVLGRIHDVVYTPAGRRWHGEKIDYLMSQLFGETRAFRQYQVVQFGPADLEVRLVADSDISPELQERIRQYVQERLDGMRVHVVRVPKIERAASGKIRVVRNDWLPASAQPHI